MTTNPQVSELLAVKIEVTVYQLQQLQSKYQEIAQAQQTLLEQARQEVGAPADHVWSIGTRRFEPPAPTVEELEAMRAKG